MKNYFTGFFTAIFLMVSSFILIGARSQFHQDIIANSIVVPNNDGSMTILDGDGITTYNAEGRVVSVLGKQDDNQGHLILSNRAGNPICFLGSKDHGGALLTYNNRGKETSQLGTGKQSHGGLRIYNRNGVNVAELTTLDNGDYFRGDGELVVKNRNGQDVWSKDGREEVLLEK